MRTVDDKPLVNSSGHGWCLVPCRKKGKVSEDKRRIQPKLSSRPVSRRC